MADSPDKQFDAVFIAQRAVLISRLNRLVDNAAVAEELTQESYLKVRQSLMQGVEIDHLKGFLFQTGRNLALDYLRQLKRQSGGPLSADPQESADPDDHPSALPSPEQTLADTRRVDALVESLNQLTERQRQVFTLNRIQGWSHARIAEHLGTSESTVQKEVKLVMTYCIKRLSRAEK
ncbi:hypothetical protein BGP77_02535 [Saccharospirillum sp. MSK14-1]|uniref:RNA polymerase sigma factor n=1 Tax=Saccharospirillum sp. MSK14-1 TaxID=1897632 RepID=UPI000D37FFEB|nr:RNA polymerase sigma factor [Saccharospirillum sp. MSK14-1]PTY36208.1 hypothetical protein BGP77_02535 [Saccharospirillum sp. MSK14-1]